MASVFKQRYTKVVNGERVTRLTRKWYVEWRDAAGRVRRRAGYTDKQATMQLAARLEREAARGEVGLVDEMAPHRKRPLAGHADDWHAALLAKGTSAGQARQVRARALAALAGCGFTTTADLGPSSATRLSAWLAERRKPSEDNPDGMSVQTSNHHLRAVKQFCRWMVSDGRLAANPFLGLAGGNVATDRRHDHRALTPDELGRLLEAARASVRRFRGLTGVDREALYLTAVGTGFRADELARLRPESFDLTAEPPTATLPAKGVKNRRPTVQPVSPEAAELLRGYLADKPAGSPVWPGTWCQRAADMIRIDLEPAGIPYAVEGPDGPLYADFHGLRHAYIALLDRGGVSLKRASELARHSDVNLTAKRYGRATLHDLGAALEGVPRLKRPAGVPRPASAFRRGGQAG